MNTAPMREDEFTSATKRQSVNWVAVILFLQRRIKGGTSRNCCAFKTSVHSLGWPYPLTRILNSHNYWSLAGSGMDPDPSCGEALIFHTIGNAPLTKALPAIVVGRLILTGAWEFPERKRVIIPLWLVHNLLRTNSTMSLFAGGCQDCCQTVCSWCSKWGNHHDWQQ